MSSSLAPAWTLSLPALAGLCFARERRQLLVWDQNHWLRLLNDRGEIQTQVRFSEPLVQAVISEDGSLHWALFKNRVECLNRDLSVRNSIPFSRDLLGGAVDPLGQAIAIADAKGKVHILNGQGEITSQFDSPRPLRFLAFVPNAPWVVASADFGLVGAVDLKGRWRWQDRIVVHIGALAVNEDGTALYLAAFSEGVLAFGDQGGPPKRWPLPEPCRLLKSTFDGRRILAVSMHSTLYLLDHQGQIRLQDNPGLPITDLALDPLGREVYLATPEGLQCLPLPLPL